MAAPQPSVAPAAATPPATAAPSTPPVRKPLEIPEQAREFQARFSLARQKLAQGDRAGALESIEEALAIEPGHLAATIFKSGLLRQARQFDRALVAIDDALKAWPTELKLVEEKAVVLREKGDAAAASALVEATLAKNPDLPLYGFRLLQAKLRLGAGDRAGALASLEEVEQKGYVGVQQLLADPDFAPLREEARFKGVVERIQTLLKEGQEAALKFQPPEEKRALPEAAPVDPLRELEHLRMALRGGTAESLPIDFKDVDGKPLRLADHAGKVVLVQAWGIWSKGSRDMWPHLLELRDANKERGLVILGLVHEPKDTAVDVAEVERSVKAYLERHNVDIPSAYLDEDIAREKLRLGSYPTTFLFGPDGKCYLRSPGFKDARALKELVELMYREGPKGG